MSTPNKHIRKLQKFPAHNTDVTSLAIGHNSGLVLATGGADNNVNLWKVDDNKCFMSLCGHVTAIECVQFDPSEYLVGSGSHTGGLNIWDLTKGKKVKTFTGHKSAVTNLEFFPFASSSYFLTGSKDTNVKLWDYRYSHCIGMYKGHNSEISSLKYSPDGLWFVSGDEEGNIKIWDLRVGKMIHCFDKLHNGSVTSIEFHPLVFLLASSGTDNKINILDLERFNVISQINTENSTIRCLQFNDKGNILYGSAVDFLGVFGIEPTRIYDTLNVKWGNMNEFVVKGDKIVGASHESTDVSTWLINLPDEYPFKNQFSPSDKSLKLNTLFTRDTAVRKSFNKQNSREIIKPKVNMKLIDERSELPEIELHDYHSGFKPNRTLFKPIRTLNRSPPPFSSLSEDDTGTIFTSELNRNLPQKYTIEDPMKLDDMKSSGFEIQSSNSETESIDSTPCDSFSLSQSEKVNNAYLTSSVSMRTVSCNTANENVSKRPSSLPIPKHSDQFAYKSTYGTPQSNRELFSNEISSIHHKEILTEDLLNTREERKKSVTMPKQFEFPLDDLENSLNNLTSEDDILEALSKDHKSIMDVFKERKRNLIILQTLWVNKNFKSAVISAIAMNDEAIISDLISIITQRPSLWCLEVCVLLLPSISNLIQSCNEPFINVAFKAIRDILHFFMPVIKINIQRLPSAIGVDIMQEERYNKCRKCHSILMDIRSFVLKRQTVQGNLGNVFRQLHMLLQTIDV